MKKFGKTAPEDKLRRRAGENSVGRYLLGRGNSANDIARRLRRIGIATGIHLFYRFSREQESIQITRDIWDPVTGYQLLHYLLLRPQPACNLWHDHKPTKLISFSSVIEIRTIPLRLRVH
ncbi:unnamed protein product [Kuraishia capsulata CBS 1993]|uniref:Uncharacterized protein n=1 Tax=Kuraishia capsulata CBS 1993 TaxID=1382522 RepID=W6MLY1_9ASCO|nr:uncharacterized protein KUCA_T00003160001 [Kuraishia capsulata CBS 1993]CDK27183.1 unnamed protein product [Kuraishia capsulata CBS 1993]